MSVCVFSCRREGKATFRHGEFGIQVSSHSLRLSAKYAFQLKKKPPQKACQCSSALINNFINEKHWNPFKGSIQRIYNPVPSHKYIWEVLAKKGPIWLGKGTINVIFFCTAFYQLFYIVYIFVFYLAFLFGSICVNGKGFLSGPQFALLRNCIGQENV